VIVSWISRDNRKAYRAKRSRARRQGIELAIHRVTSKAVGDHIVTLTLYLTSPGKDHLSALVAQESAGQHVARYIGSQKQSEDRSPDAASAQTMEAANGERVLQILTRNLIAQDLADIQFEIAAIAGLSPAGEDPIEHIVLSWPSDEHPSPDQVEEALDILLTVAGMSRHQAYAVLHGDTGNIHLHVALNRVDPVTGERRQIGLDLERSIETLHQSVAVIEHRQGWASQQASLYRADDNGCYERTSGIKVRDANLYPCASDVDRNRIRALRAQDKADRKITSEAADYERRTGLQSIQRRVIETAAPILRDAGDWDDVHRRLAAEGMRYRMLTSGAVIACGDRTIAASTAWGGASAAKMIERLGAYAPSSADIEVAPFEERTIPTLYRAAEQRRAQERASAARQALVDSADGAVRILRERYHVDVAADPRSDGEGLNDARRDASAAVASAKAALELLLVSERARLKRRRALAIGSLSGEPNEEEGEGERAEEPASRAMFVAADGRASPLADPREVADQFNITRLADRQEYRRDGRLAFVEHAERIDLVAVDDASLRAALRIAHGKWGKVAAVGDRPFLDRLMRIAVEEGIELTNPELQGPIAQVRQDAERARRRAESEAARIQQPTSQPVEHAMSTVLADYDPQFARWLELRPDPDVSSARIDASAMAIMSNPRLKLQLAELESQQFDFAVQLRRAGRRHARARAEMVEQWAAEDDHRSDGPVEVSDLASSANLTAAIANGMVSVVPLPPAVSRPGSRHDERIDAGAMRVQPVTLRNTAVPSEIAIDRPKSEPTPDPELDTDRRYRAWAERRRQKVMAGFERELAEALRARVAGAAAPPRHIAMLLLREARRQGSRRSSSAKETDRRDAGELAALSHDPAFGRVLAAVRAGDATLLQRLDEMAGGQGDSLGRVPLARGRLRFDHDSPHGHDPGARPPLEWIRSDLARLDVSRLRLTRHRGLVGTTDPDLLEAVHHNHVGLLYPEIQTQLEVEWRLQRERDLAVLYRIQSGEIAVDVAVNLTHEPYASVRVGRGATSEEHAHIEGMARDATALLDCRAAQHGALAVDKPRAASPLIAAYLRARDEQAGEVVLALILRRLRAEKPEVDGMTDIDRGALEQATSPASPLPPIRKRQRSVRLGRVPVDPSHGPGR
jgi:hypothetical protein